MTLGNPPQGLYLLKFLIYHIADKEKPTIRRAFHLILGGVGGEPSINPSKHSY